MCKEGRVRRERKEGLSDLLLVLLDSCVRRRQNVTEGMCEGREIGRVKGGL